MPMIADGIELFLLDNNIRIDRDLNKFIEYIRSSNSHEYVDEAILVFNDRLNKFYKSNIINELMSAAIGEVKQIEEELGFVPINLSMPILSELEQFSVVSMFTNLLFSMILALFVTISIVLVHSLILTSIQQQFYDIGIKRMIGENEAGIALSIVLQTFAFSFPGIILAFTCSLPMLYMINRFAFESLLGISISIVPSSNAIISSIIIGIIIPVVSSLKPIHEAIKQNINDTLDYDRSKAKADVVKVISSSDQNIGARLIFGLISTIYAISVYILLPKSLLELNLGIIMQIFFLILIGMIFGLVLIAINLQYIIEYAVAKLFFWWEKESVRCLILKNLIVHKIRNGSTSLVYSLSLSFLLLCVVFYNLQIQNMKSMKAVFHNGIELTSKDVIDIVKIEEVFTKYEDIIDVFGYRIHSIGPRFFTNIINVYLSSHSRNSATGIGVIGVSPHLFDAYNPSVTSIFYTSSGLSLSEQLYSHNGTYSGGIGHACANQLNIIASNGDKLRPFLLNIERSKYFEYFKMSTRFILDSSPYSMSKRQKPGWGFHMLVSIPSYLAYAGSLDLAFKDVPYERCNLKLKPGVDKDQK